jgi:ribosome-associated translation inhibitor RaiA
MVPMTLPAPRIAWLGIEPSDSVAALVERHAQSIARHHPRLIGLDVALAAPQKRRVSGRGFEVRLHAEVPGPDVDVARSVRQGEADADLALAINRAFAALERRLREQGREMGREEVKHHPPVVHGEVVEIEPALGYGYLRADDGREVYFQADSLVEGRWEHIGTGDRLRFREMEGEKGAFAVDVTVMARPPSGGGAPT